MADHVQPFSLSFWDFGFPTIYKWYAHSELNSFRKFCWFE